MKALLLPLAAVAGLLLYAQADAATYEGKLPAYGIAGPYEGTLETCVLDADPRKADLAESYPGTVIVRNNTPGKVKFTLECD